MMYMTGICWCVCCSWEWATAVQFRM